MPGTRPVKSCKVHQRYTEGTVIEVIDGMGTIHQPKFSENFDVPPGTRTPALWIADPVCYTQHHDTKVGTEAVEVLLYILYSSRPGPL